MQITKSLTSLSDGTSTSVETSPFTTGLRTFSNQFTVAAGQTISVTTTVDTPTSRTAWDSCFTSS